MLRLLYGVSLGIVIFALQAFAADPDNGERFAQRWCAACHVVTPVQTSTTTDQAPPFPVIAKKPGFDAARIALFLCVNRCRLATQGTTR